MKALISWVIRHIPRPFLQRVSHYFLYFFRILYRGDMVECPVCHNSFRKFMPYGRNPVRDNALCPNCLSLERHRLLWIYLEKRTRLFHDPLKFLHIAPELCFIHRFEKFPHLDYVTADLESPLAKVKMDIHQIPFENNSFDAVMCNHVMEHVENDIQAMKEIYRVLKPGGWAILQVPFMGKDLDKTYEDPELRSGRERERIYGQSDHVRLYGKDYGERLAKAGFKVKEDKFVKTLDPVQIERHALPSEETIYLCSK